MAKKTKKTIVWISVKAAAKIIGVSPCRVCQLIAGKRVRSKKNPHHDRSWLVDAADVRLYKKSPRLQGKPGHRT